MGVSNNMHGFTVSMYLFPAGAHFDTNNVGVENGFPVDTDCFVSRLVPETTLSYIGKQPMLNRIATNDILKTLIQL